MTSPTRTTTKPKPKNPLQTVRVLPTPDQTTVVVLLPNTTEVHLQATLRTEATHHPKSSNTAVIPLPLLTTRAMGAMVVVKEQVRALIHLPNQAMDNPLTGNQVHQVLDMELLPRATDNPPTVAPTAEPQGPKATAVHPVVLPTPLTPG